jgi:hypothetical protein
MIADLIDDIFHARLILDANGRHTEVDARPSDAIALAVRVKVPIYVSESVMERAAVTLDNTEEREESTARERGRRTTPDNLDIYRDFINSLDALDEFGGAE